MKKLTLTILQLKCDCEWITHGLSLIFRSDQLVKAGVGSFGPKIDVIWVMSGVGLVRSDHDFGPLAMDGIQVGDGWMAGAWN